MSKARFLRDETLRSLRDSVGENLAAYRSASFDYLVHDSSKFFEADMEFDFDTLAKLKAPVGTNLFEVENCTLVLEAMPALTPYDARDERLWTYLSHTALLGHARARWPIPQDDAEAVKHIHKHYFAKEKRQIERDNAASRLWWMGHLCQRVEGLTLDQALRAFLHKSDVRANIVERPTISQATNVFGVIVKRLWSSLNGKEALFERQSFRDLMIEINSIGGFRLLDCLSESDVAAIVDDVVANRLQLRAI